MMLMLARPVIIVSILDIPMVRWRGMLTIDAMAKAGERKKGESSKGEVKSPELLRSLEGRNAPPAPSYIFHDLHEGHKGL